MGREEKNDKEKAKESDGRIDGKERKVGRMVNDKKEKKLGQIQEGFMKGKKQKETGVMIEGVKDTEKKIGCVEWPNK